MKGSCWKQASLKKCNFSHREFKETPFWQRSKEEREEKLVTVRRLMVPCIGFLESIVFGARPKRILGKGHLVLEKSSI